MVYQLFLDAIACREVHILDVELYLLLLGDIEHHAMRREVKALVVGGHVDVAQIELVKFSVSIHRKVERGSEVTQGASLEAG